MAIYFEWETLLIIPGLWIDIAYMRQKHPKKMDLSCRCRRPKVLHVVTAVKELGQTGENALGAQIMYLPC